jgi:hypothetical protein
MEYPFLTMQQFPIGFIKTLCSVVCARSVKLHGSSLNDITDVRDKWWTELRNEIKSQMKALNCHLVLGYTELKSICEDVFVLSAMGTAAIIDEKFYHSITNLDTSDATTTSCSICHLVQSQIIQEEDNDSSIQSHHICGQCGLHPVPEVLFTTIQPLSELTTIGQGILIKALVLRPIKKTSNEQSAKIISDCLPFIEYELHRQLMNKLKLKGMNALFGLKIQISIGENVVIGKAEATAAYLNALPQSKMPKLVINDCISKLDKTKLNEIQELKRLLSFQDQNISKNNTQLTCGENSDDLIKIDLDDDYDKENVHLLLDTISTKNKGNFACNTEFMPGISRLRNNIQMFTRIHRCEKSLADMQTKELNDTIDQLIVSLYYKFRFLSSFCLVNLSFDISLYDDDHAMIICTGCCFKLSQQQLKTQKDTIFTMDDEADTDLLAFTKNHIEITTLSYVPNARIDSYLGHINLFLIRESTSVKENGGLNGFMHTFISEVLSMTRAHVLSLGGNALVSFKITECVLLDNPHKNQGQCLINVAGDAVKIV